MSDVQTDLPPKQEFLIGDLFRNAWQQVKGYKATFWGALLLTGLAYLVIAAVFSCLSYYAVHYLGFNKNIILNISSFIQTLLTLPLSVGLFMLALKHISGLPIRALDVFNFYPYILGLSGVYILEVIILAIVALVGAGLVVILALGGIWTILAGIGLALILAFFIYLTVGYAFGLPVRIEKRVSMWKSLEVSRKEVSKYWFKVFFIFILFILLIIAGALPLLIGLIWVLPWVNLVAAQLYVKLFGPIHTEYLLK